MYHDLVDAGDEDRSGFPGRDAALYKVTIARFEDHVRAIAGWAAGGGFGVESSPANADIPTHAEAAPANPQPVLTFDDGGVSAVRAAEVLERYGFVGHFFVTTNYIGTRGFVDAPQIRDLHARGHVIGSHSCSHPLRMGHCSWTRLVEEWTGSCAALADILGAPVRVASVPGGDLAPSVAEAAARAGIARLFTSEPAMPPRHAFGLELQGRFTIQRWTSTATVIGLACGAWLPCATQTVLWNAKKLTKQIGGERYLQIRRLLIGHDREVRWGDSR